MNIQGMPPNLFSRFIANIRASRRKKELLQPFELQDPKETFTRILAQWDWPYRGLSPFMLYSDSEGVYGKPRLTTFRSQTHYLIVFEVLLYSIKYGAYGDFGIYLSGFGNKLPEPGQGSYRNKSLPAMYNKSILLPPPPPKTRQENYWVEDPLNFEIIFQGERRRFLFTPEDYAKAGIDLETPISRNPGYDMVIKAFRMLCAVIPDEQLFYSVDGLLEAYNYPTDTQVFLQLSGWGHPGLGDIKKPSDSPCLQSLARAIAHNDPALYECPEALINTHWSNWGYDDSLYEGI